MHLCLRTHLSTISPNGFGNGKKIGMGSNIFYELVYFFYWMVVTFYATNKMIVICFKRLVIVTVILIEKGAVWIKSSAESR